MKSPHTCRQIIPLQRAPLLKRVQPKAQVGITLALVDVQSRGGDQMAQQILNDILYSFAPYLKGDDFLGVQNYSRMLVGPNGPLPPELEVTQMGYEFYPEALAGVLRETSKLGLPLIDKDPTRPAVSPGDNPNNPQEYDSWDHVDYIIDEANKDGLYVALLPTWGRWLGVNERDQNVMTSLLGLSA